MNRELVTSVFAGHSTGIGSHELRIAKVAPFVTVVADSEVTTLQLAPSFHRFQHRDLIGVLNVASGGNSGCDPRDLHA